MKHKVVWNSKIKCFSSNVLYQIGASDVENVKEKLTTGIKFKVAFYGKYTNIFTNDVIPKHINVKKISKTKASIIEEWPENHYIHYIKPMLPEEIPKADHKIKYTIELHRAVFTEEFF